MQKLCLTGVVIHLSLSLAFGQNISKESLILYFDKDIDTISKLESERLNQFLAKNQERYILSITIAGHTDGDGSISYNKNLSNRRTQHIKNILTTKAIHSDIHTDHHYGEDKLWTIERNEADKSKNRRVEVLFEFLQAKSIQDILSVIQPDFHQKFEFLPDIATIEIKGKKGTNIVMKRSDLIYADGRPLEPNANVEVKLNEIQRFVDQLQANISTETHNGQILESGGMYNLEVRANNQELKLASGKNYEVTMPNKYQQKDMSVFNGSREPNGQIKWTVAEQKFSTISSNPIPRPFVCIDADSLKKIKLEPRFAEFLEKKEFYITKPLPVEKKAYPRDVRLTKLYSMNHFSLWEKITIPRKERQKIIDDLNDKLQARYERLESKREMRVVAYENWLKNYLPKLEEYKKEEAAYKNKIGEMYQHIQNYRIALVEKQYLEQIKSKIRTMIALSETDKLFLTNLNGFLFSDYYRLDINKPDKYLISLKKQFNSVLMEYYGIKDSKFAYNKFQKEWNQFQDAYQTLGDWHKSANKPIVNYLAFKSNELVYKEIQSGYRTQSSPDLLYASLSSFSWVNCDRFVNTSPSQMANYDLEYNIESEKQPQIKSVVVIPQINSCLGIYFKGFQIPKKYAAQVISYYLDDNKKIKLAKSSTNGFHNKPIPLNYQEVSFSEFAKELARL